MARPQEYDDESYSDEVNNDSLYEESEEDEFTTYHKKIVEEREAIKHKKLVSQTKRDQAYQKRIAEQLENSGQAFEGKLTWANTPQVINIDTSKPSVPQPLPEKPIEKQPRVQSIKRFKKAIPMEMPIKFGGVSDFGMVRPPSPPRLSFERNTRVCKFVLAGKQCHFGDKCKFSHVKRQDEGIRELRMQKFKMCRNATGCRFGVNCVYSHSEAELAEAITTCYAKLSCRRIKREKDNQYSNTVVERKCMHLHPGETIQNYIKRTSVI